MLEERCIGSEELKCVKCVTERLYNMYWYFIGGVGEGLSSVYLLLLFVPYFHFLITNYQYENY